MMMMMMIMVVGELWLRIRKKNDCRDFWLVQSLNDNDDDNNNLLLIVKSRFVEKFFFHRILCALVWYGGYFTTDYQKFGFFSVVHFGHKSLLLLLLLFQDFNCLNLFPFLKGVHYICIEYGISSNSTITTATLNDVWRLFKTLNNNYFFFLIQRETGKHNIKSDEWKRQKSFR